MPIVCMEESKASKQQLNNQKRAILPKDVFNLIMEAVEKEQQDSSSFYSIKQKDSLDLDPAEPSSFDGYHYVPVSNWHRTANESEQFDLVYKCIDGKTKFFFNQQKPNYRNIITEESEGEAHAIHYDGPNKDSMILLAREYVRKNKQRYVAHSLAHIPATTRTINRTFDYDSPNINHETLISIAMAARNRYAIVTQKQPKPNEFKDMIRIYSYNNIILPEPKLLAQTQLTVLLRKISFITNNVLMGLTYSGQLCSLWIEGSTVQCALHQTPFFIHDFAIDPKHPSQIVIAFDRWSHELYQNIAYADLTKRDSQECIVFRKIHDPSSNQSTKGPLSFYNNTLTVPDKPSNSSTYLEVLPTREELQKLQKCFCGF